MRQLGTQELKRSEPVSVLIFRCARLWVGASPRAAPALPLDSLEPGFSPRNTNASTRQAEEHQDAKARSTDHTTRARHRLGDRLRRLPSVTIVSAIRSVAQPG